MTTNQSTRARNTRTARARRGNDGGQKPAVVPVVIVLEREPAWPIRGTISLRSATLDFRRRLP